MNKIIQQIWDKVKHFSRKDVIKKQLSLEEIRTLENFYNHKIDPVIFYLRQQEQNISCCLYCQNCNKSLSEKQVYKSLHQKEVCCSKECRISFYSKNNQVSEQRQKELKKLYDQEDLKVCLLAEKKHKLYKVIPKTRCVVCNIPLVYQQFKNQFSRGIEQNQGITCKNCKQIRFNNTCLEKFNGPSPMSDPLVKKKVKESTKESTGYECVLNTNLVKQKRISKGEIEVLEFIKNYYSKRIITNSYSIIYPYQIDIYIPELKLGIEFNGDYWHSIDVLENSKKQELKTNLCESKGIRLIHIWEHQWKNNQEFCKEIIRSYLEGKIPLKLFQNNKLSRDYFQKLDFPDYKIEEPLLEKSGKFNVYKTGYLIK